jgi:hypothetical protein
MKPSTLLFLSVVTLVAGSIALSGCGRGSSHPTTISYRPLGLCKSYETPAGPITAGANKGFAVFKILSIDNTKYEDSFTFAPERLFVNQSPPALALGTANRRFVHPDPRFAQAMGFTPIPETHVPAGEKRDINSVIIIPLGLNHPSGGAEANQFSYELAYDTGVGDKGDQQNVNEGIVFTITNPPDPKWPVIENCKELPFQ